MTLWFNEFIYCRLMGRSSGRKNLYLNIGEERKEEGEKVAWILLKYKIIFVHVLRLFLFYLSPYFYLNSIVVGWSAIWSTRLRKSSLLNGSRDVFLSSWEHFFFWEPNSTAYEHFSPSHITQILDGGQSNEYFCDFNAIEDL